MSQQIANIQTVIYICMPMIFGTLIIVFAIWRKVDKAIEIIKSIKQDKDQKRKPRRVSFYEGVYLLQQGEIIGLTEYEGQHSFISLDKNNVPQWTSESGSHFRYATDSDKKKFFFVIEAKNAKPQ